MRIGLIKSTFFNERDTKKKLADFILKSDKLSMGEETKKFEKNFAKKQKRKYAVFVNSGSTANILILQALLNLGQLKVDSRIGFSALTWATNVMPIIQLGMVPVAIDCEIDTLNISPKTLQQKIKSIDALFVTNVLGFADDIGTIQKICKREKVILWEDNCESLGSKVGGTLLGNFGVASTFSFFVGHHMSTVEGGMVVTDDEKLYHELLMVRAHGWDRNVPKKFQQHIRKKYGTDPFFALYTFYTLGYNVRPTDIQSFVGTIQLSYVDTIVRKREKNFRRLYKVIEKNPDLQPLRFDHMDVVSNFAVPIIAKSKKIFLKYKRKFENAGVEIRPIIAGNITRQPFYKKYVSGKSECPNADFVHENGFYFGNNPDLTEKELVFLESLLNKKE